MPVLSKSKLIGYRQCPKRLWLEVHSPELRSDSSATVASFAAGHQVGEIARTLYDPKGMGTTLDIATLGVPALLKATKALLLKRKPIFEAGFGNGDSVRGALALADVLKPERDGVSWRLIEVKSSTSVKEYYLDDVAIQYYVATKSGVALKRIHLAHIDSTWTYPGDGDYNGLLIEEDVTEPAKARQNEVKRWLREAHAIVAQPDPPQHALGRHCQEPFACGFEDHCRAQDEAANGIVPHPIEWLPGRKSKAFDEHVAARKARSMNDVPDDVLSRVQQRVKTHTISAMTYFDAVGAAEEVRTHRLPALFLDFETASFAVPIWAGTRPYEQIPFQFSLHRLGRRGAIAHSGFLDLTGSDPSERIAKALVAACGTHEPIFAYNKGFEGARLKSLANRFRKLSKALLAIESRLVDLHPIAAGFYYHPDQHGSWSIKKVLPAIAPELNYEALDEVQDGGGAQSAYQEAIRPETSPERQRAIRDQLWRYCRLDTFAMIRLWSHFAGRAGFVNARDDACSVEVAG
jgi:hypothetical protein